MSKGETMNIKYGELIRQTRIKQGMTQKKLAQKCGISNSFLCEIEKGKAQGSLTTFIRLINALEIDGRDIFFKNKLRI